MVVNIFHVKTIYAYIQKGTFLVGESTFLYMGR